MASISIHLTPAELFQAAVGGVMRQAQSLARGKKPAHGADNSNDWQINIEGCLAEYAVAKYLGVFWSGNHGSFAPGDVGQIEVRSSQKHENSLIIRSKDPNSVFVFVTGVNGSYQIHGWISANEAKQPHWLRSPNGREPAYFVPKNKLYEITSLGENHGYSKSVA